MYIQKQQCDFVAVKEFKHSGEKAKREWEQEVAALKTMNAIEHEHIVQFLTAFTRGDANDLEHYVVFEFATGGNLDDFWKDNNIPTLSRSLIKWVLKQMHGLATALAAAHYQEDGTSYRHGDLKPANILWFKSPDSYGTLKIGDWGEARRHKQKTSLRDDTQTRYGTRRYEPPELARSEQVRRSRSRLYDVWSFGCIALEFVIWLMYGRKELERFNLDNEGKHGPSDMFYELDPATADSEPLVHQVVNTWMDHMSKQPACHANETALGALLEIIRTGLLVVNLPAGSQDDDLQSSFERSDSVQSMDSNVDMIKKSLAQNAIHVRDAAMATPSFVIEKAGSVVLEESPDYQSMNDQPVRMLATDLEEELRKIKETAGDEADWDQIQRLHRSSPRSTRSGPFLSIPPNSTHRSSRPEMADIQVREPKQDYGHPPLDPEDWEFLIDNDFAGNMMSRSELDRRLTSLRSPPRARLCKTCVSFRIDLYRSPMKIYYSSTELGQNSSLERCDLCKILWKAYSEAGPTRTQVVTFERRNTTVWIAGMKHPVLTLYQSKGKSISKANDICVFATKYVVVDKIPLPNTQIGLPQLPETGGDLHLELIRGWINDCNQHHFNPICQPSLAQRSDRSGSGGSTSQFPTRLIDVGTEGDTLIRLREMQNENICSWTALSYRWGQNPYSTTRQNIDDHVTGMELSTLPQTFKDAVKITRAIGQRYLWIDSICIVQGEDGDFSHEALRMEDVYSGAYCVLAASGATDLDIGFLTPRANREYAALPAEAQDEATLYVCQTIEDFRRHVLKGALSNRGWVLQEHALARRTIFFTEYQTYWECGHGIRCETMVKMKK